MSHEALLITDIDIANLRPEQIAGVADYAGQIAGVAKRLRVPLTTHLERRPEGKRCYIPFDSRQPGIMARLSRCLHPSLSEKVRSELENGEKSERLVMVVGRDRENFESF